MILLLPLLLACGADARWETLVERNGDTLYPVSVMDSLLAAEQELPASERAGLWARRFAAAESVEYRFGLAEDGYASRGLLACDRLHDCVSLVYRVSELARARDHQDALRMALETRFAGADLGELAGPDERLDYDHPSHLDYSLDMVRSGRWGRDLVLGIPDAEGTARYPAGSFSYLPETELAGVDFHEGDIAWLVLDPSHEAAGRLRREHGLAIGHLGVIVLEDGEPWLVHAASSPLEGCYEGGRVVKVRLQEYLLRVERFRGLILTRFPGPGP